MLYNELKCILTMQSKAYIYRKSQEPDGVMIYDPALQIKNLSLKPSTILYIIKTRSKHVNILLIINISLYGIKLMIRR